MLSSSNGSAGSIVAVAPETVTCALATGIVSTVEPSLDRLMRIEPAPFWIEFAKGHDQVRAQGHPHRVVARRERVDDRIQRVDAELGLGAVVLLQISRHILGAR